MKESISILLLLFSVAKLQAQIKVTFIVKEQTTIKHNSIYIVGTFNNWDSLSNKDYLMKPLAGGKKTITLNLKKGPIKYKFHRGTWLKVEKYYNNQEVPDREVFISRDTILVDSVQGWRDEIFKDKKTALAAGPNDSLAIVILASLAGIYAFNLEDYNVDSAFHYAQKAIDLQQNSANAKISNDPVLLFALKDIVAALMHSLGNFPKALEIRLENVALTENVPDKLIRTSALLRLTDEYVAMEDYKSSLLYGKRAEQTLQSIDDKNPQEIEMTGWIFSRISESYYHLGKLDSALVYALQWEKLIKKTGNTFQMAYNDLLLGDIYQAKGDLATALYRYQKIIEHAPPWLGHIIATSKAGTAKIYQVQNKFNIALKYALAALHFYQNNRTEVQFWGESTANYIAEVSPLVASLYMKIGKPDSAYHFLQLSLALKDSLYNTDRIRQFQTLSFNEAVRRQQLEQQKISGQLQFETRMKIYGLITVLIAALIFAIFQHRNNRQKQKANTLLHAQKLEIENTLGELQHTQRQLIQSEKLASLGELTAGIAHEIQNPLNFVNNFSEVSTEMLEEMEDELDKGNHQEVKAITADLKTNLEKINHHGQRASAIVKGMLEHSRQGGDSTHRVSTDINALADEYLRLAYHGWRAKDSRDAMHGVSTMPKIETHFDPDLPLVSVIPQDIGRVLLNLINNAFYAVHQRAVETLHATSLQQVHTQTLHAQTLHATSLQQYQPTVTVSTEKSSDQVIIKIQDNGNGIPESIQDKIFQPFFTTKPTGHGTGLGLSLAYDIVTKGHGGTLTVSSIPSTTTTFEIRFPLQ
jgi:signal transduction histidine kinase